MGVVIFQDSTNAFLARDPKHAVGGKPVGKALALLLFEFVPSQVSACIDRVKNLGES